MFKTSATSLKCMCKNPIVPEPFQRHLSIGRHCAFYFICYNSQNNKTSCISLNLSEKELLEEKHTSILPGIDEISRQEF